MLRNCQKEHNIPDFQHFQRFWECLFLSYNFSKFVRILRCVSVASTMFGNYNKNIEKFSNNSEKCPTVPSQFQDRCLALRRLE